MRTTDDIKGDDMGDIIGRMSSFQSMGAVDGPGLRCVVFLQGCPLRCAYCHNPETWEPSGGEEVTVPALVARIRRYRSYLAGGGVTVSGGEPLMQAAFTAELFRQLQTEGFHTALDTSGAGAPEDARMVLAHTDLVICDLKFPDAERFRQHCHGSLSRTLDFLALTAELSVPLWLRQVIVPGLNDTPEDVQALWTQASQYPNLQKIELLPFRRLCVNKYEQLCIPFPLADTPECPLETIAALQALLPDLTMQP